MLVVVHTLPRLYTSRRNPGKDGKSLCSLVVIVLLLASVAMFVGVIHRIGRLQINRMLIFTGDQGTASD
jgi:hypothetical protein